MTSNAVLMECSSLYHSRFRLRRSVASLRNIVQSERVRWGSTWLIVVVAKLDEALGALLSNQNWEVISLLFFDRFMVYFILAVVDLPSRGGRVCTGMLLSSVSWMASCPVNVSPE